MSTYVFGPVPSRRLGRSLGIDLVPFKTCTYDCIYCQLGCTNHKTAERREWVPVHEVLAELQDKIKGNPDYITLSGSGEPTLYSQLGELIRGIKEMTDIPVAVLTNGSLLWKNEVRSALLRADLVIPSLDAGDERLFRYINRPHPGIDFDMMIEGLIDFRSEFSGKYWLEALLLNGLTGLPDEFRKLATIIKKINPDKVQLNTVARPPAEDYAYPVAKERMDEYAKVFGEKGEVIADYRRIHAHSDFEAGRQEILRLLNRRPCTIDDITNGLDMHKNETIKYVEDLYKKGEIKSKLYGKEVYYLSIKEIKGLH